MTKQERQSARNTEIALQLMVSYVDRHFPSIAQQLRHDVQAALFPASKAVESWAEDNLQALSVLRASLSSFAGDLPHIPLSAPDPHAIARAADDPFQDLMQRLNAGHGRDTDNSSPIDS